MWLEKTEMVLPLAGPLLSPISGIYSATGIYSVRTESQALGLQAWTQGLSPSPQAAPSQPSAAPSVSSLSAVFFPSASRVGRG